MRAKVNSGILRLDVRSIAVDDHIYIEESTYGYIEMNFFLEFKRYDMAQLHGRPMFALLPCRGIYAAQSLAFYHKDQQTQYTHYSKGNSTTTPISNPSKAL